MFAQSYQFVGSATTLATRPTTTPWFSRVSSVFRALTHRRSSRSEPGAGQSARRLLQMFTRKFPKISGFTRLGLSYSLTNTRVKDPSVNTDSDPNNNIPVTYSQPSILTSRVQADDYVQHAQCLDRSDSRAEPVHGIRLFRGFLGGDVNTFSPTLEYKYFRPMRKRRTNIHRFWACDSSRRILFLRHADRYAVAGLHRRDADL
jgi:hypothetical protein